MEMVRHINQSAALLYEAMPAAGMQYRGTIEMPAHLSILPVAQRFLDFARNDDTRKTIHALSMLAASWHLVLRHKQ